MRLNQFVEVKWCFKTPKTIQNALKITFKFFYDQIFTYTKTLKRKTIKIY